MLKNVRIINFDDSIVKQKRLLEKFRPSVIDLQKIGPQARLWLSSRTKAEVENALTPDSSNAITFLGSGDFHHISSLLIGRFSRPLTVISFDFHPDWDIFPPKLGCGSWITNILNKPDIDKVILLGASSIDISSPWIQAGNLKSLKNNRVEIYPYSHEPTLTVFKKVPDNASIKVERGIFCSRIHWRQLKDMNLSDLFFELMKRIRVKDTYVSIDKDCLKENHSLTNWESGFFELGQLLFLLKLIKDNLNIVGMDIAGDYSFPAGKNRFKAAMARLDHPDEYSASRKPDDLVSSVNEQTNLKILQLLT